MRYVILVLACVLGMHVQAIQDPNERLVTDSLSKLVKNSTFKVLSKAPGSNGVQHIYGIQMFEGRDIFMTEFNAVIKEGKIVLLQHSAQPNPAGMLKNEAIYSPQEVLKLYLGLNELKGEWKELSPTQFTYVDSDVSDEAIKIQLRWMAKGKNLIPVVDISMQEKSHLHHYKVKVSQYDASELHRSDMVIHCDFGHSLNAPDNQGVKAVNNTHQLQKKNADASYQVFERPIESPNHGNRSVVEDPHDTIASPFGWHSVANGGGVNYTITRGNNAFAYEDRMNNNGPGYSPDGGSTLEFITDFDKAQGADNYTDASIVNLFYWNNIMHDIWYHYGFDEQSGNFQRNNYNNGGVSNDEVRAEAQDGSGSNNANFYTPEDGFRPRMQMYIWRAGGNQGDYLQVNSPASIQGKYLASTAAFGPSLSNIPITADLVLADPLRACGTLNNSTAMNGKIAFIERGDCNFTDKVRNAQAAGAIAAVLYDSTANDPIFMGGTANDVSIPVVMIRRSDGLAIKNLISSGVNVSLYDSSTTGNTVFDSDFDGGIIAHEYGHGISIRLTGGAANSECLTNQEQMGEGWSDFFSLVMTHEVGDQGSDVRGIGTYVTNQSVTGGGIRPYPYSTDKSVSPYTYNNIKQFSVPHGVGSVWCAMLWDMYWAFIDEYGYDSDIYYGTGGNNIAMQLVMDGLKLQKCSPGFVDGRDAILLADRLNNNGKNQRLIWEVFAARGLGASADQGSSESRSDGIQAFDLPAQVVDELFIEKTASNLIFNGNKISYTLKATNYTPDTIYNVTLLDTLPLGVFLDESDLNCDYVLNGRVLSLHIDSFFPTTSVECTYDALVKIQSSSALIFEDDMESGVGDFVATSGNGTNNWARVQSRSNSGDYSWFVQDVSTASDQYLSIDLGVLGSNPIFSFYHFYNTEESWDGGVVEVSTNGGNSWLDAGDLFFENGYNLTIATNPASAISGRKAFTGNSGGWIESSLDLSIYGGQSVQLRFRMTTDAAAGGEGWYVDDVKLTNANVVTNTLYAEHDVNKRLSASAKTIVLGEALELSVEENEFDQYIKIYPNPNNGSFNVRLSNDDKFNFRVIDINGKLQLSGSAVGRTSINLTDVSSGIYFIEVESNAKVYRKKLMIY